MGKLVHGPSWAIHRYSDIRHGIHLHIDQRNVMYTCRGAHQRLV